MDNNKEIKFDELPIYKVSLNQMLRNFKNHNRGR
jgi:hypothetical protein